MNAPALVHACHIVFHVRTFSRARAYTPHSRTHTCTPTHARMNTSSYSTISQLRVLSESALRLTRRFTLNHTHIAHYCSNPHDHRRVPVLTACAIEVVDGVAVGVEPPTSGLPRAHRNRMETGREWPGPNLRATRTVAMLMRTDSSMTSPRAWYVRVLQPSFHCMPACTNACIHPFVPCT